MDLCPVQYGRRCCRHPLGRLISRYFAEDPFARPLVPYWLEQPLLQECNIGNAVGQVSIYFSFRQTLLLPPFDVNAENRS